MTYSFMRRSAEKNSPKSVRKLGEDPGEDASEGRCGPYTIPLEFTFSFSSGAQPPPFLAMRIDSESLNIGAYGLKVFWREVTLEVVPRSEHRHKIKSDDEHNQGVMPASRPRPRQGSEPTYYCATPMINI